MDDLIALTAAALRTNWTRYKAIMNDKLRQELVSLKHFTPVRTLSRYAAANITVSSGNWFQPYQSAFTTSGDVSIDGEAYVLQDYKLDKKWTAEQLDSFRHKWDPTKSNFGDARINYKFFTDTLIMNYMYPGLEEDIETIMLYKAKRVAPTAGVASITSKTIDGLEAVINNGINASKIIPKVTGNFNDGIYYDRVLQFCDSMTEVQKNTARPILCDPDIVRQTHRDVWSKNKAVQDLNEVGNTVEFKIPGTNKTLVGTPMMSGKKRLICDMSPNRDNLLIGLYGQPGSDKASVGDLIPNLRFQEFDREIKILGETQVFIGVEDFRNLVVSDGDPAIV